MGKKDHAIFLDTNNMKAVYDKNMQGTEATPENNVIWYDVSNSVVDVYGFDNEGGDLFSRWIPKRIAATINEGVLGQSGYATGGRIRFWTNSKSLTIKVQYEAGAFYTLNLPIFVEIKIIYRFG